MTCRTRGVGELRRECLHSPVDGHVVDLDAALGKQLLHIAIGQPNNAATSAPPPRSPPAGSGSRPDDGSERGVDVLDQIVKRP